MNDGIQTYIESKDWTFKFKNGEYCLDQCPLCNAKPGHFYISQAKETFYCHKCRERGHILSLKKKLGDLPAVCHVSQYSKTSSPAKTIDPAVIETYHKELLGNPAALAYLTDERGFSD